MKKYVQGLAVIFCLLIMAWAPLTDVPPDAKVRNYVLDELEACRQLTQKAQGTSSLDSLKSIYLQSRRHYKHIEFFVEYVSPREAKYSINGALVFKYDPDWPENSGLQGFQRIEELLFSASTDVKEAQRMFAKLSQQWVWLMNYYRNLKLFPADALEMQQLQLYRMVSLNLNGYDATFLKNNVEECLWNLEGMEQVLGCYSALAGERPFKKTMGRLELARTFLNTHKDFDQFPRLAFIVQCITPLNASIVQFHRATGLPWNKRKQALNLNREQLFDAGSFNKSFFSMYYDDTLLSSKQAALGKVLFFDPLLSGNDNRSCASCHDPGLSFTDGLAKARHVEEGRSLGRNTPSLWNVGFQQAFFYDGRAGQLEQQVFDVIHSKEEMNADLSKIAEKLKQSLEYRRLFREAFKGTPDSSLTAYAVQKALTEFEKTLVSLNSPFDRYLRVEKKALTAREVNGYNLFAGKALCGSCHFFPLFNGTVPPSFTDSEFEVIGTPATAEGVEPDKDEGRYRVFRVEELRYAFKTPGLRNMRRTAPYMHNGVYKTLEEVVDFYHRGGGQGLGIALENQTLPFDSLQLSDQEKEDLVLFLRALDDPSAQVKAPETLPRFESVTKWNARKVGGEY